MGYQSVLICACLGAVASAAKLPSSFTKCDWNDSPCLTKSVENVIRQLTKPFKEVNVPSMHPLEIPSLNIGAGSGPVAFQQNYKDVKVTGYDKIECSKVEFNPANTSLVLDCLLPELDLKFQYEVNGRILVLPIRGKGPGLIVLHKCRVFLVMQLEEHEKKGSKHYRVASRRLYLNPELITLRLDNLFDGDKALGDNINQVMNDNWQEVFADVKPSYEDAFGKIYESIFNALLAKVPISDLVKQ